MPADPQAFAQRVLDAFTARGHVTDALIEAADGPSTSTMTKLRKVAKGIETMPYPREPTWSKIDRAAGWQRGSARGLWFGRDPRPQLSEAEENFLAASMEDVITVSSAFDAMTPGARAVLVDIAHELASDEPERGRPDWVISDTTGTAMAVELKRDGNYPNLHEIADPMAVELLWDQPHGTSVVVGVFTPDGEDASYVSFRKVALPPTRVRQSAGLLDQAARDIGKPSRGQQKRDAVDQAGEPVADDPEDMEPR